MSPWEEERTHTHREKGHVTMEAQTGAQEPLEAERGRGALVPGAPRGCGLRRRASRMARAQASVARKPPRLWQPGGRPEAVVQPGCGPLGSRPRRWRASRSVGPKGLAASVSPRRGHAASVRGGRGAGGGLPGAFCEPEGSCRTRDALATAHRAVPSRGHAALQTRLIPRM